MVRGRLQKLTGRRFGTLLVLYRAGRIGNNAAWMCKCDCGVERIFRGDALLSGRRRFCGAPVHRPEYKRNHQGLSRRFVAEYVSWKNMLRRCCDPKTHNYINYGGRGIKVCVQWKVFENFIKDMGQKPEAGYTIERKDVHGNYEPGNCRWATRAEQARNTTRSVYVEHEGKRILLHDLVNSLGLSRSVIYGRLKLGWPLREALSIPVRKRSLNGAGKMHKVSVAKIRKQLIGLRFGTLVVEECAGSDIRGKILWQCRCDCGKVVVKRGDYLLAVKVRSCGIGHRYRGLN